MSFSGGVKGPWMDIIGWVRLLQMSLSNNLNSTIWFDRGFFIEDQKDLKKDKMNY